VEVPRIVVRPPEPRHFPVQDDDGGHEEDHGCRPFHVSA
jgi:hypothetical protein